MAVDTPVRVCLVNMPWARIDAPSIQCGLLQAIGEAAGHHVESKYLNLELAGLLGTDLYGAISSARAERLHLFGEWLFAVAAFGRRDDGKAYVAEYPEVELIMQDVGLSWADAIHLRNTVLPKWIDDIAADSCWDEVDVVGFTSTFFQNVASLATARALKQHHPHLKTLFGGANFDGTMGPEYVRSFSFIDFAVVGEGDRAFPAFLDWVRSGSGSCAVPGVVSRGADGSVVAMRPQPPFENMDELPTPDYVEYFEALERLQAESKLLDVRPRLLMEFSRGCWWGAKHHCVFCGLNALGMTFRSKSRERAFEHLAELLERHQVSMVDAVDNIIDTAYLGQLTGAIAASGWDLDLFFEVKANMSRAQIQELAMAGITRIQPGIESLDSRLLALMKKGATKLINIRLLKWAKYYGLDVSWNMLGGFPGETDDMYDEQIAVIDQLTHLQPPQGFARIWLERFSPYFTDPPESYREVKPRSAYGHVYPETVNLNEIAYFWDYESDVLVGDDVVSRFEAAISRWQAEWAADKTPVLEYRRGPGWIRIHDTRCGRSRELSLRGWQAAALLLIDAASKSRARVARELAQQGHEFNASELAGFLDACISSGLVADEGDQVLFLAIPTLPIQRSVVATSESPRRERKNLLASEQL